jgi:diguanylate cyclase (GGDEF)-like protein
MMGQICITRADLAQVLPMHLLMSSDGTIRQCGATVTKMFPGRDLTGQMFFDCFKVRRPCDVGAVDDILANQGAKLHLVVKNDRKTSLKAVAVSVDGGDGVLLDMSFGISVVDAIRDYDLTISDFSATDLAVEMLYLIEAKSAAMAESRKLNTRLQGAKVAAEEQAFTDTLTGLKNRRAMDHVLTHFVEANEKFGLMQVDLDFFKRVNDTLGHAAGDHVLNEVAKVLLEETRSEDLVARVGGDEFVLVFHRMTDIDKLNEIAARIIQRLEEPISFNGQPCLISASIGTAISDGYQGLTADKILMNADLALYASKNNGRACNTVFSEDLIQEGHLVDVTTPSLTG